MRYLPSAQRRKQIRPDDKILLRLTAHERDLIVGKTFAPEDLTERLIRTADRRPDCRFTLSELDELGGYVAAEANHANNRVLRRELDEIFAKIDDLLERYTDGA